MKKIVITGFSGFVASHFVEFLYNRNEDVRVYGLDRGAVTYDYDVVAYANTVVSSYYGNYVDEIASEHSNPIHVQLIATAIDQVEGGAQLQVLHGAVMVQVDATVYNLNGQILTRVAAGSTITLQPGIYVIKAGEQVYKVKI